ncbi:hypothetical protein ACFQ2B_07395 [Streptomyces stramineus]
MADGGRAARPPGAAEGAESLERVDPPNGRIPMPRQTGPRRPGEPRRPLVPRQQARPGPGPVDYVGERPPPTTPSPPPGPPPTPAGSRTSCPTPSWTGPGTGR